MATNYSVLFVCLGNICRSPLAEAAFRCEIERLGLDVEVDSAGTGTNRINDL
jgi:protein-tyrosine phosphatase